MKIDYIHPCICVDHIPESGDDSHYGMPQLKLTQIYNGIIRYTHLCPNCGRGGLNQFKTVDQALKGWNEMQERLWAANDGKPVPYVKKMIDTLPRNGYDNWIKTHNALDIAPGEHFSFGGDECRIRSDGNAVLVYDWEYHDWISPSYRTRQLEYMIKHKSEITPLPFEKWNVNPEEPDHIWHRYVHTRLCVNSHKKHLFRIAYIDGYDMKYKTFETEAESKEKALDRLWGKYKDMGDFDHQICEVVEIYDNEKKGGI